MPFDLLHSGIGNKLCCKQIKQKHNHDVHFKPHEFQLGMSVSVNSNNGYWILLKNKLVQYRT